MQGLIRSDSCAPILFCAQICLLVLLDHDCDLKNTEGKRRKWANYKDLGLWLPFKALSSNPVEKIKANGCPSYLISVSHTSLVTSTYKYKSFMQLKKTGRHRTSTLATGWNIINKIISQFLPNWIGWHTFLITIVPDTHICSSLSIRKLYLGCYSTIH